MAGILHNQALHFRKAGSNRSRNIRFGPFRMAHGRPAPFLRSVELLSARSLAGHAGPAQKRKSPVFADAAQTAAGLVRFCFGGRFGGQSARYRLPGHRGRHFILFLPQFPCAQSRPDNSINQRRSLRRLVLVEPFNTPFFRTRNGRTRFMGLHCRIPFKHFGVLGRKRFL